MLLLAPALALLFGCSATARITGDFDEYALYRRSRVAETLEDRLGAGNRYLDTYPRGDYRDQVRTWFEPEERRYFRLAWDELPRLRAYLNAMPNGPHAGAVAGRIVELEAARGFGVRREARELSVARAEEARLAQAREDRATFVREITTLMRLSASVSTFGEPTSALDSELIFRFRLTKPYGSCAADVCKKALSFAYLVPAEGGLVPRRAEVLFELILERGLLRRITISGPELFTRLAEAAEVHAIRADDAQARAEAIAQSLELVERALAKILPESACSAEAISPVVFARACHGIRVRLTAGTDPGEPDRFDALPQTSK
jgi:hypothetical protein